jgi:hypothetical protein
MCSFTKNRVSLESCHGQEGTSSAQHAASAASHRFYPADADIQSGCSHMPDLPVSEVKLCAVACFLLCQANSAHDA